jgi:hypothetical protein
MSDLAKPVGDFVTSTLSGALAAGATTATIASGLSLPATNGILHINYDSTVAVGTDEGPETIQYATYTTATGALAGITRGLGGTTDVAHANGSTVSAGISVEHLNEYDRKNVSNQTIIGNNDYRATRFVPLTDTALLVNAADPTTANWTDVDCTASTSAKTYAVCGYGLVRDTAGATGLALNVRPNGSTDATGTYVANTQTTATNMGSFIVGVDTDQIFEYKASDANIDSVSLAVTGYWEYVD